MAARSPVCTALTAPAISIFKYLRCVVIGELSRSIKRGRGARLNLIKNLQEVDQTRAATRV